LVWGASFDIAALDGACGVAKESRWFGHRARVVAVMDGLLGRSNLKAHVTTCELRL
jgi:hypothetical protein